MNEDLVAEEGRVGRGCVHFVLGSQGQLHLGQFVVGVGGGGGGDRFRAFVWEVFGWAQCSSLLWQVGGPFRW